MTDQQFTLLVKQQTLSRRATIKMIVAVGVLSASVSVCGVIGCVFLLKEHIISAYFKEARRQVASSMRKAWGEGIKEAQKEREKQQKDPDQYWSEYKKQREAEGA